MNKVIIFGISGFLNCLSAAFFGGLVFSRNPKRLVNKIFLVMSSSIAVWGFGYGFWLFSLEKEKALFWSRILNLGATFIPVTFLHWVLALLKLHQKKKKLIIFCYFISFIFALFSFSPLYVRDVEKELFFNFWPKPGILYNFYLLFGYIGMVSYATFLLIKKFKTSQGYLREQIKYILLAIALGFGGGATNFPLWYGIPLLPLGNFLVFLYPLIIGYAITRYRLMEIRFVLGRTSIYLFSFILILGGAWFLIFLNESFNSPFSSTFLALALIFVSLIIFNPVFHFFEKLASKYFYYTFYSYQKVIKELGQKLSRILDIEKLSQLLGETLINTLKIEQLAIIKIEKDNYEVLKIKGLEEEKLLSLLKNTKFLEYLAKFKKALGQNELSSMEKEIENIEKKTELEEIREKMKENKIDLALPLFHKKKIIGLILLGKKISGNPYSREDIELLTTLASQASIAFQNAFLYSEIERRKEELERFYKLTVGRELRMIELKKKIKELEEKLKEK